MTDWTGNKKSTFTTLGASSHALGEREENDYYATHPSTIKSLFDVEEFNPLIWECACGGGHLSKAMEELGKEVVSTDLVDRGYGLGGEDFMQYRTVFPGDIITNPPYKFAQEFVEKAIELTSNKVAMFLKLTFLEGQKRRKMFEKFPPKTVYVFSQRQMCAKNGKFEDYDSSAAAYAWFVWEKGFIGSPVIKWI